MQRSSEAISVSPSHSQRELDDAVLVSAQQTSKARVRSRAWAHFRKRRFVFERRFANFAL